MAGGIPLDGAAGGFVEYGLIAPDASFVVIGVPVHPNTAHYGLRRIEERTGCNLRHSRDLFDLLVAIALDDERSSAG